jgi:sec-independent protein translocase protein TatC
VFYRYYTELKSRAFLLLVTSFSIFLVSYIFKEVLLSVVINSYSRNSISELSYFIFTDVVEIFNVYVYLIFFIAKQIIFFYFFYHGLIFIAPGLTKLEYRFFIALFATSTFLFILSALLFKKILFPFSWSFFLSFKNFDIFKSLILHFEARLVDYVSFFFNLYFSCIFYFQFFLFPIFFFTYLGKKFSIYKSFRKFLYYGCIFFSTLVTPPDVTSQVILSLTLIVGCEILVYCSLLKSGLKKELVR